MKIKKQKLTQGILALSLRRVVFSGMALLFLIAGIAVWFAPRTSAAISLRSSSTGENAAGTASLTINKPAGVQVGDVMIAIVSQRNTLGFTHPSGWTFVSGVNTTGTLVQQQLAYKVADSADLSASSYTWTISSSTKAAGVISAYSGVDISNPINISGTNTGTSSITMTANSINTTTANTMILAAFSSAVTTTFTAGSGMTLQGQVTSSGGGATTSKVTVGLQDVGQVTSGTTGSKTMTAGTAAVYTAHTVALTPAPPSTLTQASYGWFANQDSSAPNTFAAAVGGSGDDKGYSIAQAADESYLLAGYVTGFGGGGLDASVVKYDAAGNVQWRKVWGGAGDDKAQGIVATPDGGFAIAGITTSYGAGGSDAFLAKFDSSGTLTWSRTWGGTGTDYGYSLANTSDGGYVLAGNTASYGAGGEDLFFAKFDNAGNLSWSRLLGGTGTDYARNIKQTSDGSYIMAGYTSSYGTGTASGLLVKYDSAGNHVWTRTWGGSGTDYAYAVTETSDGGYAMTGTGSSFKASGAANTDEAYLAKFDSTGALQWSRTWGGGANDYARMVEGTSDGGVIITGSESSFTGNYNAYLAKFDSSGALSWSRTWGAAGTDNGFTVIASRDGGYAQAIEQNSFGAGTYDMTIAKYDSAGLISGCGATCTSPAVTTTSPSVTPATPAPTMSSPSVAAGTPSAAYGDYLPTHTVLTTTNPSGIDVGSALAASNTAATAPASGTGFRLRLNLHIGTSLLGANTASLKLRYAPKGASATCSAVASGNYADVTDSSAIRYFDNPNAGTGMALTTNINDPLHSTDTIVRQAYFEKGTATISNPVAVSAGQDGMWDFALTHVGATPSSNYCFKITDSAGSDINTYTVYPELTIPAAPVGPTLDQQMRGGQSVVDGIKRPFNW